MQNYQKAQTPQRFQGNREPEITQNRVKPNALDTDTVWDVGFRYTYLPEWFIENGTVYIENVLVALPLNPTYV